MKISRFAQWVFGFAVAMGLLGAVTWLNWHHMARMQETAEWVNQTQRVRNALNLISLEIRNSQANERGYVITGDPIYIERFQVAVGAAEKQLKATRSLTAGNQVQQSYCTTLEPLLSALIQTENRQIELRRSAGFEAAQEDVATGKGRKLMDEIRATIAKMDAEEVSLEEKRTIAATEEVRITRIFTLAATGLSLVLLAGVFAWVLRENQLRQRTQAELDDFFNLSLDMLCIANADGYFKRLNPAFADTLGYSTEELLSRPFIEFVHPDDREPTMREVERQVVEGGKVLQFENRYRHKNGSWRVLSWKSVPHPGAFMFAAARDVTELREREAQIEALNVELRARATQVEAANKELESFSYSVSHDLRAPLRHVHGYVEMLQRATEGQLSDKAKRYLRTISDASIEMGQLIDDLLAFSRMGRVDLQETRVTLGPLVQEVITGLEMQLKGRDISWTICPLPDVQADASMIKQVLVNLIGNAVKYTRKREGAKIEIFHVGGEQGQGIFCVRDNGAGFDLKYAHKLFAVFQRLHRADEFEGTGIGLATVRRIVARHGGRTWAEGKLGEGAAFYFTLKLAL
ncbi:MAG: sensor histidine kinase [Limisphaerales bacterium]